MKRIYVKNGDILEIPLDKYMPGYGYAKYLDSTKVWGIDFPGVLRIYNFVYEEREVDIAKINRELIMAPIAVAGIKGISKLGWKIIGNEPITENEKFMPHAKGGWPHIAPVPERWLYYEEFGNPAKQHFAEYENVKHLEKKRILGIELIPFKIVMEKLRIEKKDIKDFVKKMDGLEEIEYKDSFDLPIYSQLPESMKGRVIK